MKVKIKKAFSNYNLRRYMILTGILILMLIGFSLESKVYVTPANFTNIAAKFAEIGLIAASMSLVMLTGDIDLSVGSVMCFCAFLAGTLMQSYVPVPLAVLISLAVAAAIGFLNGFMIAVMKMQPVIVTLGTMTAFRGLCYVFKQGGPMRGLPDESFFRFGNGTLFGVIPYSFILVIVVFVILSAAMKKTRFGMDIRAIGNNASAAAFSGIKVRKYKIGLFTFNGFISGLAGIVILSRMQGIEAALGDGYEFEAITMCLLGGISINGGKGTMLGSFIGIIVIGYLKSGMNISHISAYYQSAILGAIILLSVIAGNLEPVRKKKEK
ncbi:ABC transporter permease [Lacrimispora sp. NSJ-141]|uniref:Autoinducer 2 import system permease protein LsrD n=1 Tax=Lientehia hominis TaxID=2897778 RepID=A0AAP2W953_9FIRM|nr:ABC transporter permease [Lientehia hominis]MCD2491472.1 ABC transporter permease [Lientehia hominis]